jgi:Flp pilus assembly protein CpaB
MPAPSPTRRRDGSPTWQRSPLYRWLRRPLVYWGVVGVLVVVTVVGVTRQSERRQQLAESYGELREVPVAVALIRPGEPLGAEAVRRELRPTGSVPPGAVAEIVGGAVAAAAIYPGEVIHAERVVGSGGGLSGRLAAGTAAVSVPASYGFPAVHPGDRVNLIAVYDTPTGDSAPRTRAVAHHATVLELAEDSVTVAIRDAEVEPTVSALVWGTVAIVAVGAQVG